MEVYRKVVEKGGKIFIDLVDSIGEVFTPSRLVGGIAKEYNVDSEALLDNAREFLERYDFTGGNYIVVTLKKDNKTAEELKREIKRVTRDFERFIQTLIDAAKELRERQDLEGWLWKEAKYDTEKRRFIKCD